MAITASGTVLTPRTMAERAFRSAAYMQQRSTFADFTAAATAQTIPCFTLPARCGILGTQLINTACTGGALSALTVSLGVVGTVDKFEAATSVFTAGTLYTSASTTFGIQSTSAATVINATYAATSANMNAATAGIVDHYVFLADYNFYDDET